MMRWTFYSADRGFARFPGLCWSHPFDEEVVGRAVLQLLAEAPPPSAAPEDSEHPTDPV